MLGMEQVIAVINKMDLVNYSKERFEKIKKELIKFLSSINVSPKYIIPISAKDGDNITKLSERMNWYNKVSVLEALEKFKPKKSSVEKALRLPVQDIYRIDNKNIIVGRIESGKIKLGQEIVFLPSLLENKVESVEVFQEDRNEAEAGESIGITIKEDPWFNKGEIISEKDKKPIVTNKLSANIFWMSEQDYLEGEEITLRCTTQEVECFIQKIQKRLDSSTLEVIRRNDKKIKNNEVGEVIILTRRPIVAENFNNIPELGRFVLVRDSRPVAGGIITNI